MVPPKLSDKLIFLPPQAALGHHETLSQFSYNLCPDVMALTEALDPHVVHFTQA